jgi:glutamine synthetase
MESHRKVELIRYAKSTRIEGKAMLKIGNQTIVPSVLSFVKEVALTISALASVGADTSVATAILKDCNETLKELYSALAKLEKNLDTWNEKKDDELEAAKFSSTELNDSMVEVRKLVDHLELVVSKKYWPLPSYGEIVWHII